MPKKYKLLENRFEYPAGTICYDSVMCDYGLASDDTIFTGDLHISVTLKADGGYPFFTVPVKHLQEIT